MQNSSNLVSVSRMEIDKVTGTGKEFSLTQKKDAETKGALIFLEGKKDLTLTELKGIGERITCPLSQNTQILWSVRMNEERKRNSLDVVYVY